MDIGNRAEDVGRFLTHTLNPLLMNAWKISGRLILSLWLCAVWQQPLFAQEFMGYHYNNYMGVYGVVSNPASIAASPYQFHINIFSASVVAGNNAYELNRADLFHFHFSGLTEGPDYQKIISDARKNGWAVADVLGPSVLISLDKKSALGIATRLRVMAEADDLGNGAFNLFGNPNPAYYGVNYSEQHVRVNANAFADMGISYARVLEDNGDHLLKAGITLKYIQGFTGGTLGISSLNVNMQNANSIQTLNGAGSLAYAQNLDQYTQKGASLRLNEPVSMVNGTAGMDFGMVYEHRPGRLRSPKGAEGNVAYDFRFSLSVTDLAFAPIRYKAGNQSAGYLLTADNVLKDTFTIKNAQNLTNYLQGLQTRNLASKQVSTGYFSMSLPSSIHTNVDWHLAKNIFINADAVISLRGPNSQHSGTNYISTLSLTPRWETKTFSVYSPVSVNVQKEINWGIGFRVGPLFVGSASVLSDLFQSHVRTADAYMGISIPIFGGHKSHPSKRPGSNDADRLSTKDSDGDGIPDRRDKCPFTAGPAENNGCPLVKPEVKHLADSAAREIYFAFNSSAIDPRSYPALDTLASTLLLDDKLFLDIEGHTDNIGTHRRNMKLSLDRAGVAKEYLVEKGVHAERIAVKGYGETRPVDTNFTEEGRARNRRIVLVLSYR